MEDRDHKVQTCDHAEPTDGRRSNRGGGERIMSDQIQLWLNEKYAHGRRGRWGLVCYQQANVD